MRTMHRTKSAFGRRADKQDAEYKTGRWSALTTLRQSSLGSWPSRVIVQVPGTEPLDLIDAGASVLCKVPSRGAILRNAWRGLEAGATTIRPWVGRGSDNTIRSDRDHSSMAHLVLVGVDHLNVVPGASELFHDPAVEAVFQFQVC